MRVHSFPPISDESSRILVLGSMPGKASLRARQYYAHPQNLFWKIMGALLHLEPSASYDTRVAGLRDQGIALWDVLKSCTREGSLDSEIDESSIIVNDFPAFLKQRCQIRTICFNGKKAEESFRRYVAPGLAQSGSLACRGLPSTSPANASIPYAIKIEAWRAAMRPA